MDKVLHLKLNFLPVTNECFYENINRAHLQTGAWIYLSGGWDLEGYFAGVRYGNGSPSPTIWVWISHQCFSESMCANGFILYCLKCVSKTFTTLLLNNSENQPIIIIFDAENTEHIVRIRSANFPSHLKIVITLHCLVKDKHHSVSEPPFGALEVTYAINL